MRLTGGSFRGKKFRPKGLGKQTPYGMMRATGSKVREAVFNIIGPRIEGVVFADLYAGGGTVGMEAMSRGAGLVYLVEADKERASALDAMLSDCGCGKKVVINAMEASVFVGESVRVGRKADIVFLDPPYEGSELNEILCLLGGGEFLADEAIVIAEHSKKELLPDKYDSLCKRKEYKYGDTRLTLYGKD